MLQSIRTKVISRREIQRKRRDHPQNQTNPLDVAAINHQPPNSSIERLKSMKNQCQETHY